VSRELIAIHMTAFASSLLMSHIIFCNKSEDRKINQLINFKDT
jgi:hypothetical protein